MWYKKVTKKFWVLKGLCLIFIGFGIGLCFNSEKVLAEDAGGIPMYRLYNPNSSEHFYTANDVEKKILTLTGWRYEGIGWYAPASGAAVYRLYNSNAGDHHYTLDGNERAALVKAGWQDEGIGWYSSESEEVPLFRLYNARQTAGAHHYTTALGEKNQLMTLGWQDEGIAWYAVAEGAAASEAESLPSTSTAILDVPLISQLPELPTGCEITAVTMMLQYKGVEITKEQLANEMPRDSSDPNKGYVGDPFTRDGWTVYPPALMGLVKKYAGSAHDLTGQNFTAILVALAQNKPVVTWLTMHGFSVHAVTVTGFQNGRVYFNDPWVGQKNVSLTESEFQRLWNAQARRAISY